MGDAECAEGIAVRPPDPEEHPADAPIAAISQPGDTSMEPPFAAEVSGGLSISYNLQRGIVPSIAVSLHAKLSPLPLPPSRPDDNSRCLSP